MAKEDGSPSTPSKAPGRTRGEDEGQAWLRLVQPQANPCPLLGLSEKSG